MASPFSKLEVDEALRPKARAFSFDLDEHLSSVMVLTSKVADDAFTARTLGTLRLGNAVVISPGGLVLTIGYLVTEAEAVTLTANDGRQTQAHVLGVDAASGFALVQALEPLDLPALRIGDSRRLREGRPVISAGGGGRAHASAGELLARSPFAGYWEYCLDEALFVEPAHPHWSGAALIGPSGELMGVGSLRMERRTARGDISPLNMFVPAELLPPILDDLAGGRPAGPARPWLGVLAQENESRIVILDASPGGPASRAELRRGDVIRKIAGQPVTDLAGFYKRLWALGSPGVTAPLTLQRGGETFDVEIRTADRAALLKKRRLN